MKLVFARKKRGKYLFKLALMSGLVYAAFIFANQRMLISNKKKQINEMKEKISLQEVKIAEIRSELDALDSDDAQYVERIARQELKLSKLGERVFVNAKGN